MSAQEIGKYSIADNEQEVIIRLSDADAEKLRGLTDKDTEPMVAVGTVRTEETSVDHDWDTLYSNEFSTFTPDDVDWDEYQDVIIVLHPEGCRIMQIPAYLEEIV